MKKNCIKKVLIVAKLSMYDKYIAGSNAPLKKLYRRRDPSIANLKPAHQQQQQALKVVTRCLRASGVAFKVECGRETSSLKGYDLIIALGGDGTLLRTSHRISCQPLVGVNSAPVMSVGALCSATAKTFPALWKKIIRGKARLVSLQRLEVRVNGKKLKTLALNDVLFSNVYPAGTSRYLIRIGKRREEHKSSGIWVATASGSTAAILAAGGKIMPPLSRKIQYRIREPYPMEAGRYKLKGGILSEKTSVSVMNKTIEALLSLDGVQFMRPIRFGDRIEIRAAQIPLTVIE